VGERRQVTKGRRARNTSDHGADLHGHLERDALDQGIDIVGGGPSSLYANSSRPWRTQPSVAPIAASFTLVWDGWRLVRSEP
jgi:hypothetical protein